MSTIQFGPNKIEYIVTTLAELITRGFVKNPFCFLGSAWMFCIPCNKYTYHYAMSHQRKDVSVCRECNQTTEPLLF